MKRTAMFLLLVAACARQGGLEVGDDDGLGGSSPSGGGGTASGGSSSGNATLAGTSSVAGRAGAPSGGSAGATSGGNGGATSGGNGSSGAGASGGKAGAMSGGTGGSGTGGGGAGGGGAGGGGAGGNGPITQTDITARFKTEETNTASAVPAIHGELRVVNVDGGNAALNLLKVRYYFTNEGTTPLFQVRWGQLQSPTLHVDMAYTGTVVSMPNPTSTADSYIEFKFSGTNLLDAGKTAVCSFRLYDSTNQAVYRQDNDYSFSATPVDSDKVVVFYKDSIIWGVEPQ